MDDMNMNNEPPVYDSGDMKPTDPIPTEGENDAGLTEELPMYEDTSTGDRGGRKKIIAIAAGVVLIAGLGIGAFALSSHKTANTQRPSRSKPSHRSRTTLRKRRTICRLLISPSYARRSSWTMPICRSLLTRYGSMPKAAAYS